MEWAKEKPQLFKKLLSDNMYGYFSLDATG